jgi:hypothetical protein
MPSLETIDGLQRVHWICTTSASTSLPTAMSCWWLTVEEVGELVGVEVLVDIGSCFTRRG